MTKRKELSLNVTEEDTIKLFQEFEKSEEWFSEHYKDLEEKYADMMLAIKDKEVVSASPEIEELFNDLKSKNVGIDSVYITTIPPKGIAFIL